MQTKILLSFFCSVQAMAWSDGLENYKRMLNGHEKHYVTVQDFLKVGFEIASKKTCLLSKTYLTIYPDRWTNKQ